MEASKKAVRHHISIHAPREGGDSGITESIPDGGISIHAPREGGDSGHTPADYRSAAISIHAPREGGDCKQV